MGHREPEKKILTHVDLDRIDLPGPCVEARESTWALVTKPVDRRVITKE
jgi:hypothetical protein